MKSLISKIAVSIPVFILSAVFSFNAAALNDLAEGSFDLCTHAVDQAREAWPRGAALKDLDDDEFVRAMGFERIYLLSAAGHWDEIRAEVLDHGLESSRASRILWDAAGAGRTAIVKKLIELGMSPDGGDVEKVPLSSAAACGHVETVKALLKLGANPNFQDVTLQDAMAIAIAHDDWGIGKLLMEYDYDPCVLELKDGRGINDLIVRMRAQQKDFSAAWHQLECRRE